MGNGASQSLRQGCHSDSRISALRLDGSAGHSGLNDEATTSDTSHGQGNNTITLRLSLDDYAVPTDEVGARKPRARSLTGADSSSATAAEIAAAHHRHALHALDEGREDHNSSAASVVASSKSNNEASPRAVDEREDIGAYDDEAFEDDTIEWKRGEALGSGSYGTVYLARDERSGALMAVKEIVVAEESEDDVRNASREVALLRSLRHTNIVKYLGSRVDYEQRKLHIFTEWVPGGNLEQNRKRFGGSERVVRRFTQQILRGVAYLHAKHIIHHDIKPSNLLVDQFGVVKLADFGASRLISTSTLVNNESMRGTPNYMAPEVIKQSGPRSFKSDIWSVGCSVLRLLTGRPLWGDKHFDSQIALLYFLAHLEQLPPLPEMLSPEARSFIQLCLEIDPTKRPTAEELLTHPFVGGAGGSSGGSFLLPSRSTLLAMTPRAVHDHDHGHGHTTTRGSTAPVALSTTETAGRGLVSAPGASVSPVSSKSQLLGSRFPSRGLFDESTLGSIVKGDLVEDDATHDGPELLSLSLSTKAPHRSSRALRTAAGSLVGASTAHDDASELYTFSEFAETVVTTTKTMSPRPTRVTTGTGAYGWEDQPILTDAARIERERQLAHAAEEQRKKEERERQFQEELVAFRRDALQQHHHHAR